MKNYKLVVEIESNKTEQNRPIRVVSVYVRRTNQFWNIEQLEDRGLTGIVAADTFNKWGQKIQSGLDSLAETLNWNLNGDSSKYKFRWGQSGKSRSTGYAYIVN